MEYLLMNKELDIKDFIVGIDYDSSNENQGFFNIRRKVTILDLAKELQEYIQKGPSCPTFPPEANPIISYTWDFNNNEDGDCYDEINDHIDKLNERKSI